MTTMNKNEEYSENEERNLQRTKRITFPQYELLVVGGWENNFLAVDTMLQSHMRKLDERKSTLIT